MQDFLLSMRLDAWALPALVALPLLGALLVRLATRSDDARAARNLTLAVLALEALLGLALCCLFEPSRPGFQFVLDKSWIPAIGARFAFGLDGISLVLVVMTVLLMPLSILGGWADARENA